jgi:hypothetical protein
MFFMPTFKRQEYHPFLAIKFVWDRASLGRTQATASSCSASHTTSYVSILKSISWDMSWVLMV